MKILLPKLDSNNDVTLLKPKSSKEGMIVDYTNGKMDCN